MKTANVVRAMICFALLVANSSAQPKSTWVTLAPKGSGFSISLPRRPENRTLKRATYTAHMYSVNTGSATFTVHYADCDPSDPDLRAGLVANRDTLIEGMRARLTSSREITVDGHTGLEFTGESFLGEVRGQLFIVGTRMFQMMAIVPNGKNEKSNVNRFFNSFRLARAN